MGAFGFSDFRFATDGRDMIDDPLPVRALRVEELDGAAETLAAAFEDYPWTRHVVPSDGYRDRVRQLQRLYLEYAMEHGLVAAAGDCAGVIALLPHDAPAPSASMLEHVVDLHGRHPSAGGTSQNSPTAWRLETLGVRPEHRGEGLAGRLIEYALIAARVAGARAVVLETSDERNCRLYERHGFVTVTRNTIDETLSVWTMHLMLDEDTGGSASSVGAVTAAAALQDYLVGTNTHDFRYVERVLAPDAIYFFGDATCRGVHAVREYFEHTWRQIPDERYWAENIEWLESTTDSAVATYVFRWMGTLDERRSGGGRATNVFHRTESGWWLVHEHLSGLPKAPVRIG
jgi:GNAT superfamily N-acetyltransferase/ketosteroid isomerase-like protein